MIMWYLAVALLALRLKRAAIWERLTAPVEPIAWIAGGNPTAQLATFPRTAEGLVVGRHRPEYVAAFA